MMLHKKFYYFILIIVVVLACSITPANAGASMFDSIILCDGYIKNYIGVFTDDEQTGKKSVNILEQLGVDHEYQLKDGLPIIGTYGFETTKQKFGLRYFTFWYSGAIKENKFIKKYEVKEIEKICGLSVDINSFNQEIIKWEQGIKSTRDISNLYFLPYSESNWKIVKSGQSYYKHIDDWIATYNTANFSVWRIPDYIRDGVIKVLNMLFARSNQAEVDQTANVATTTFKDFFEIKRFESKWIVGKEPFDLLGRGDVILIDTIPDVITPCPKEPDGPCGFDLKIVATDEVNENGDPQTFYFVEQGEAGDQYFGPFKDNLSRIIKEGKEYAVNINSVK